MTTKEVLRSMNKIDVIALVKSVLQILLLLLVPFEFFSIFNGEDTSFYFDIRSCFYFISEKGIQFTLDIILVVAILLSTWPILYYRYKIQTSGRTVGSMKLAYGCFLTTVLFSMLNVALIYSDDIYFITNQLFVAVVFVIASPILFYNYKKKSRDKVDSIKPMLKEFFAPLLILVLASYFLFYSLTLASYTVSYSSNISILGSYVTIMSYVLILLPEAFYQFNVAGAIKHHDNVALSVSDSNENISWLVQKITELKKTVPGIVLIISILFSCFVMITLYIINNTGIDFNLELLTPLISIPSIANGNAPLFLRVTPIFLLLLVFSGDLLFLYKFLDYLTERITKRRLVMWALISLWFGIFTWTTSVISLVTRTMYPLVFYIPTVQLSMVALMKRGKLERFTIATPPLETPSLSTDSSDDQDNLISVPLTYLIRSWIRKLLKH
ncbi:MAG: hypothetical protein ACTSX2_01940 [Candidatus Thorarchaeota archaeon]